MKLSYRWQKQGVSRLKKKSFWVGGSYLWACFVPVNSLLLSLYSSRSFFFYFFPSSLTSSSSQQCCSPLFSSHPPTFTNTQMQTPPCSHIYEENQGENEESERVLWKENTRKVMECVSVRYLRLGTDTILNLDYVVCIFVHLYKKYTSIPEAWQKSWFC